MSYNGTFLITLYKNVPFSRDYTDHPFCIQSPSSTKKFLDMVDENNVYVYSRLTIASNFNVSFNNLFNTTIRISLPTTSNFVNANYMRVETSDKDLYFFIIGVEQKNGDVYNFYVELDVIMTYASEIYSSLQDKPLMTKRKMCYRFATTDDNTTYYLCKDIVKKEDALINIKPNKVSNVYKTTTDDNYLVFQFSNTSTTNHATTINKLDLPFLTKICPARGLLQITDGVNYIQLESKYLDYYNDNNIVSVKAVNNLALIDIIKSLRYSDLTHNETAKTFTYNKINQDARYEIRLTITYASVEEVVFTPEISRFYYRDCELVLHEILVDADETEYTIQSPFTKLSGDVYRNFIYEPKLWCSPVRDYKLKSSYSDGVSIPSPLILTYKRLNGETKIKLTTYTTPYAGDTSIFTSYDFNIDGQTSPFIDGKYSKLGIGGTPNYSLPTSRNSLDYFNQTNSSSFFTGKVFSAIANIANNPNFLGATLTASNIGEVFSTYEDLSNTPESVSSFGTNYIADFVKETIQPYIVEYSVSDEILNQLSDYFYNNGYSVNKECYFTFNRDFYNNGVNEDNYLFTRKLFNYIELNENIIDKLNLTGDNAIPPYIKERISDIFNKGIKLWTFFDYNNWFINANMEYEFINKYYLKSLYENIEI